MAPHLQLLTLGAPLLLTASGEQIKFRTRKHFALLIRLAVEAGRRLTRDYLMDLLWGDAPAHLARHSLAQALTVLREKVGRERVLIQRAAVVLPEGTVDADVLHLDAREVPIRGPFLDGFEVPGAAGFEQWKDQWRGKLGPRIRDCLVRQMDAGRRLGDFATVERHAQVLHEVDPLSEDAVRGLMEARAWVGDRSNALQAYTRLEQRLAEELGAKPSPDLVRIADLLREGRRAAARPPRPAGSGEAQVSQVSERQEKRFEAETLIGREQDFAQLYDAWLAVRRRTPRILVLTGDPGVGKTTLVNAFASTCQMEGAVVARAQAYDAERELPFAVLAELIKQLALQRAIGGAEPEALSELSRISAEILHAFPGVPKPVEWAAEVIPLRLADAFLKAVEAATEESPLVLVVDDIHAADNASAAILHMVARKLSRTRLLLILTGRTNELRTTAAPGALVSDATVPALQPLELDLLTPDAAERLVSAVAAQREGWAGELPSERILRAGNGNPLALELLTREWVAHGSGSLLADLEALNTQPVATLGIPRAIVAVFERQRQRLDAANRAALDLAAVLGRRLADLPLYEVVGLSPAAAGEAFSRLREEGLLREIHGGLEFRNELIRAQAYYAITAPARQHLHREVGERLAGRVVQGGKERSSQLEVAWHFLRGSDAARALAFALAGAEAAIAVGAPYEAERILGVLLTEPCAAESLQVISLLYARALLDQSKAQAALPTLERLLCDASLLPKQLAEAAAMRAAAEFLLNREEGARFCEAADLAVRSARKAADQKLLVKALFQLARSGIMAGDLARVQAAELELEQLLQEPHTEKPASVLHTLAYCRHFLSDPRSAACTFERAFAQEADPTNPSELITALTSYAHWKYCLCELRTSHDVYSQAFELSRKIGDDCRASIMASKLCQVATMRGAYAEAIELGLRSVEYGRKALSQPDYVITYINLAEAYMLSRQTSDALLWLEEARKWMERERNWHVQITYLLESASFALMLGNVGHALDLTASVEQAARGREPALSDPSLYAKFTAFRAAHVDSDRSAMAIANKARERFRERHPMNYLNALGTVAWLERRQTGRYTPETEKELGLFDTLGAVGKRAILRAQGFLE